MVNRQLKFHITNKIVAVKLIQTKSSVEVNLIMSSTAK